MSRYMLGAIFSTLGHAWRMSLMLPWAAWTDARRWLAVMEGKR